MRKNYDYNKTIFIVPTKVLSLISCGTTVEMIDRIVPLIMSAMFAGSVYYIKKTESCPCTDVDISRRNYLLGASYFMTIYQGLLAIVGINTLVPLIFRYPYMGIAWILIVNVCMLVWCIFTIQYVRQLKKCKCPDSIAEEVTYGLAITELISWVILVLPGIAIAIYFMNISKTLKLLNKKK